MAPTKKTHYVADGQQENYPEADTIFYTDEPLAVDAVASEVGICAVCGELLAWHEQACTAQQVELLAPAVIQVPAPSSSFAYPLGHRVQPAPTASVHTIIWRGQVKERQPDTGLVRRVNVYRLDNGFWDCYYEQELLAA